MSAPAANAFLMKTGRARQFEQWRDNGDGTCTRLDDGLTLSYKYHDFLPYNYDLGLYPNHQRLERVKLSRRAVRRAAWFSRQ